jgi:undecaprenyl-diphosphatase
VATETTQQGAELTVAAADAGSTTAGRAQRWRDGSFGPASELPYRRRTSDWIRLGIAAVVLTGLSRHVNDVTNTERSIFELFNTLPSGLHSLSRLLYGLGTLWAVGLVVAAALLARRWRLARDMAIAGVAAWAAARVIGALVVQDASVGKSLHAVVRFGHDSPSFPLARLALVAAVICVASPYVTRASRRLGQALVVAIAVAAMYLGTAYPNDVLAAFVLGWGIAAAVHLVFRSPGGRPTTPQVRAALDDLGIAAHDVHLAPAQPTGSTLMLAADEHGPLRVKVLGRDEADARVMSKLWRFVVYKDSGPELFLNRQHDVQHQAYTMLLAERAGARVPEMVAAGKAGPGAALLVARPPAGPLLSDADGGSLTDDFLRSLWRQVSELRAAGIAHGHLNASSVVVAADGPAIVDFDTAAAPASTQRIAADVAELLASTAGIVGEERAVDAAVQGLGKASIAAAVPVMQPAVLTRETRHAVKHKQLGHRVKRLRELSATATGTEVPTLEELHRVNGTNLAMAVGTLVALVVLLGQVGSPQEMWDTIKNAQWGWVFLAFVLSLTTNVGYAIALFGTVPIRLPLIPTTETQLAMSFSNLAIPAVGGIALQIRYLQKQGVSVASAVAAGGFLSGFISSVEQICLFVIALALSPASLHTGDIPTSSIVDVILIAILVVAMAAGLVFGLPRLRQRVMPPLKEGLSTLWSSMRSPKRLGQLFAGNILATLLYGFVMLCCILAFGGHISFWTVLALNIGINTIAAMVPIPGGNTAVSTIGMSGGLTAVGVSETVAVAAVLLNQIVVNYIPALMGWFATRHLMEHEYI